MFKACLLIALVGLTIARSPAPQGRAECIEAVTAIVPDWVTFITDSLQPDILSPQHLSRLFADLSKIFADLSNIINVCSATDAKIVNNVVANIGGPRCAETFGQLQTLMKQVEAAEASRRSELLLSQTQPILTLVRKMSVVCAQ
eukprot:TRINITY_DN570_c0_g2_i6.p1 TRINITY_DN570_c0_g2~~TRINITY_DN570_c0_g2_i6.p1  ORF type:complete len:144 (+),score=36.95 TRINITY_DN570_c0_g2_i6:124-555(+)